MNLKHLRYFVTVAELGSFTAAAEQLHLAQPAVSMAIQKLERSLSVQLFHRHERQISLTDEGNELLILAKRILMSADEATLAMKELSGLQRGEVRIGIPGMLGSYYFPPILMAFRHQHPALQLSVIEAGTRKLQQMLINGEIDIGVIVEDTPSIELDTLPFLREQMMVVMASDHPLATKASIDIDDLSEEELVLFKEGYFHREVIDKLLLQHGIKPHIGFETNLIPLIKQIVKQGFGISTLLEMVIKDEPALIARPFSEPVLLDLCIAWRKNGYLSKANRCFIDFVAAQKTQP
ncbi:LysR family transcriptional regulator [Nitrincola alkalisediminis]|uniref:LysR family transcriptional regulator n=1 Tax=Nitrincola alkalisediminis TaxID=1366656 RepID=UPI00187434C6|nr:LysR family transcriptional regulator [Nitrincola alkalisediminis]